MCFIKTEEIKNSRSDEDKNSTFSPSSPAYASHDDIINEEIEQEHAEKAMRDKIIDEVVEEMF